jgi:plastocyanin
MIPIHRRACCRVLLAVSFVLPSAIATAGGTSAAGATISISGFVFHPESTSIKVGERVTWTNDDPIGHNVSFKDGSHSATSLSQRQSYSRVFDQPGTYEYFCGLHSYMTGRVIVTAK